MFKTTVLLAVSMTVLALPSRAAAQPANPITQALRTAWTEAKTNVRASADVMPEAKYGFKPVDTVRSFGAILAHVAGASYEFCAAAKGEKTPYAEDEFEKSAKTKAEIVKALDGAIAYCDDVYKTLDDAKAAQMVNGAFGGRKAPRAAVLCRQHRPLPGTLREHRHVFADQRPRAAQLRAAK